MASTCLRQRELHEDGVHFVAAIQIAHDGLELGGGDRGWRREQKAIEAKRFAGGDFAAYVDFGGGVLTYEDRGQAWDDSCGSEAGDFLTQIGVDFFADGVAVEVSGRQVGSCIVGIRTDNGA